MASSPLRSGRRGGVRSGAPSDPSVTRVVCTLRRNALAQAVKPAISKRGGVGVTAAPTPKGVICTGGPGATNGAGLALSAAPSRPPSLIFRSRAFSRRARPTSPSAIYGGHGRLGGRVSTVTTHGHACPADVQPRRWRAVSSASVSRCGVFAATATPSDPPSRLDRCTTVARSVRPRGVSRGGRPWCARTPATGRISARDAVTAFAREPSRLARRLTYPIQGPIYRDAAAITGCPAPPTVIAATPEDGKLEEGVEVGKVEVKEHPRRQKEIKR